MDKYKEYIAKFFQDWMMREHRASLQNSLLSYLGIKGKAEAEYAINKFDNAFISGTGINKVEFIPQENGEIRYKHTFEYNIEAEFVPMIPVTAEFLGYITPPEEPPTE